MTEKPAKLSRERGEGRKPSTLISMGVGAEGRLMGNRADRKQLAARFRGKEGGVGFCPHHTRQAEDERKQLKCIIFFFF